MSEEEWNYYNYRKWQLDRTENDNEELEKKDGRGRGKGGNQKNDHLEDHDFLSSVCGCGF